MNSSNLISVENRFAWYPVRTQRKGWKWWEVVKKKIDSQWLIPVVTYEAI